MRRFSCTTREPRTHCARSLSGVQMITRSTRGSRRGHRRRRRQRIVGFELDHRPDRHAHSRERLLEQSKLREQVRFDAFAGLVSGPERCGTTRSHGPSPRRCGSRPRGSLPNRCDDATHCGDLPSIRFARGRKRVVVAEQFPGPVDEVNVHAAASFSDSKHAEDYARRPSSVWTPQTGTGSRTSGAPPTPPRSNQQSRTSPE